MVASSAVVQILVAERMVPRLNHVLTLPVRLGHTCFDSFYIFEIQRWYTCIVYILYISIERDLKREAVFTVIKCTCNSACTGWHDIYLEDKELPEGSQSFLIHMAILCLSVKNIKQHTVPVVQDLWDFKTYFLLKIIVPWK